MIARTLFHTLCVLLAVSAVPVAAAAEKAPAAAYPVPGADAPVQDCLSQAAETSLDIESVSSFYWDHQGGRPPRRVTPPLLRFVMFLTPLRVSLDALGLRVEARGGSYTRVDQQRYDLASIRVRSPSGHRISGQDYPAELLLLHRKGKDLLIISVFIQQGAKTHPILAEILDSAPNAIGETASYRRRYIDTALLLPGDKGYYLYDETLSDRGCGNKVRHVVMKQPIYASHEQLMALRGLPGNQTREPDKQGDRRVLQTLY